MCLLVSGQVGAGGVVLAALGAYVLAPVVLDVNATIFVLFGTPVRNV